MHIEVKKRCYYFENVALDFVLLVLKLYPIQVFISLPLWIKLTKGSYYSFFCATSAAFLATNHFSLLLIDRYIIGYSANYNTQGAFVTLFYL